MLNKHLLLRFFVAALLVSGCSKSSQKGASVTPEEDYVKLRSYAYSLDTAAASATMFDPTIDVKFSEGPSQISLTFVDAEGHVFDPSAGQIVSRERLPSLATWSGDAGTKTSTSLRYAYHEFPETISLEGSGVFKQNTSYYQLPAAFTKDGKEVRIAFGLKYLKQGSYSVTITLPSVHKAG